jgi:RNA polymerase sigma-70 factor (ECF subfamily)
MELSLRARVRAGDPDAFGVLFTAHAREVYNLGYRLRGSWPDAEEIVSLTFLEAWRLRDRVNPDGDSLRPWLAGIAVNVTRNFSRTSRRHAAAMARLPALDAVPDFADELADRIDDVARLAAVRAAFGRLRASEQDVVALCIWSGLDYVAAAEALGIPVGTVRSRLSRARRKLRAHVTEPGPGSGQVGDDRQMTARPQQGGTR